MGLRRSTTFRLEPSDMQQTHNPRDPDAAAALAAGPLHAARAPTRASAAGNRATVASWLVAVALAVGVLVDTGTTPGSMRLSIVRALALILLFATPWLVRWLTRVTDTLPSAGASTVTQP